MFRLLAESPAFPLLPVRVGGQVLSHAPVAAITQILPFAGQRDAVCDALHAAYGVRLPAPNRVEASGDMRVAWSGLDEALALGPPLDALDGAAIIDQSDAWVPLKLKGAAADVLARLCPIDLRPSAFPPGSAARTGLGHVPALLLAEDDGVLILVPKSMAAHSVEEVDEAIRAVSARSWAG